MASTFHQEQQVTNSSPGISLSQKKNKMSKAVYQSLLPDPTKVGVLYIGYDVNRK